MGNSVRHEKIGCTRRRRNIEVDKCDEANFIFSRFLLIQTVPRSVVQQDPRANQADQVVMVVQVRRDSMVNQE